MTLNSGVPAPCKRLDRGGAWLYPEAGAGAKGYTVDLLSTHEGQMIEPTQPRVVGMFIYASQSASRSHEGDPGIGERGGVEWGHISCTMR